MKLGNKLTKNRNNEAKFKNQWLFFEPNNFKSLKQLLAFNQIVLNKLTKTSKQKQLDLTFVRLSPRNGLKMQENSKTTYNELQPLQKHKIVKPLISLAIIWVIGFLFQFLFTIFQLKLFWMKKCNWATSENGWDLLLRDCTKGRFLKNKELFGTSQRWEKFTSSRTEKNNKNRKKSYNFEKCLMS